MEKLSFYKSIFDKEQNRRNELNNSINQPITLTTILTGLLYFIYGKIDLFGSSFLNYVIVILLISSFALLLASIYFLAISFNNLFSGFEYLDLPKTKELFDYQKEIEVYNTKSDEEKKVNFDDYLIGKYVKYSDNFIEINDKRSLYLYKTKRILIAALAVEMVATICFFIKINIK